jgi:hypothetical protein
MYENKFNLIRKPFATITILSTKGKVFDDDAF